MKAGDCGTALRTRRYLWALFAFLTGLVLPVAHARAQQIFRWTDERGTLHFGDQPPPNAKGLEAKTAAKSEAEMQCEAAVREVCYRENKRYVKANPDYQRWSSDALQHCLERGIDECEEKLQALKPKPTEGVQRYIATGTLHVDPGAGESLKCEMRCRSNCRGPVEIRTDRVLKRGENYGKPNYAVEVKPDAEASAFCSVTTPNDDVSLVLAVVRDGHPTRTTEAQ